MMNTLPKYFKRIFDDYQVLVKVNQEDFTGIELSFIPTAK